MQCIWNSFLWEVIESNTMTEKGAVIHNAGSKCEPRLQGQSNLMLQQRKWSFARSERNFLFFLIGNTLKLDTWIDKEGNLYLGSKLKVLRITFTKKINRLAMSTVWCCVKTLFSMFYIIQKWCIIDYFYLLPSNSLVNRHNNWVLFSLKL